MRIINKIILPSLTMDEDIDHCGTNAKISSEYKYGKLLSPHLTR